MKRIAAVLIFVLAGACVGCQPPINTPAPPPAQQAGTIHIEGDSVTFLTYYNSGVPGFWTSGEFVPGSSAAVNPANKPAMKRVPRMVAAGKISQLVWALGPNDIRIAKGTWSTQDQWIWYNVLANKVPAETCIVIAKPWVMPSGWATFPEKALNSLSSWIDAFAADHPNVVVVDWKPIFEAHPEYAAPDGVHISGIPAAIARDAMYREGLSRCG